MRVHSRVQRLERDARAIRQPEATRQDAMTWSQRFRDHDPANVVLWNRICAWGAKWHSDYIYAERGDDLHAGECMKSLYYPVTHAACDPKWCAGGVSGGFPEAPELLRRLTDAAWRYQQETGDVFRLELQVIDWLAPPEDDRSTPRAPPIWLLKGSQFEQTASK